MDKYLEKAKALRNDENKHYNCAQAVIVPFCSEDKNKEDIAYSISANFAKGMKRGITCGAITGALMTLGLNGIDSMEAISEFHIAIKEKYDGLINCSDLLKRARENGIERKTHCDQMVYDCVELVEKITQKYRK